MSESTSVIERNKVFEYVMHMLGGSMVDIDLDPRDYEIALDRALSRYRQRCAHSLEESYSFLELIQDQNEYRLPDEVIEVQSVFRRSVGSRSGMGAGGSIFEPFTVAWTNSYLLSGSMMGGIATYHYFAQYQELVGKMFGAFIEFSWNAQSHRLTILQRPYAQGEQILLKTHNYRPDFSLLTDIYAAQWLRDYTLATCKLILGEARAKYSSIAGPSQAITLNGNELKTAATQELEKLDKELDLHMAGFGNSLYTFIIG